MKKIVFISLSLLSSLVFANELKNKGPAAVYYGEEAWYEYKCASCHGNKGERKLGLPQKSFKGLSNIEVTKKIGRLKFDLAYNKKRKAARIKEHKIISSMNNVQIESIGKVLGNGKVRKSTESKKTVETLETPWGTAGHSANGSVIVW